MLWERKRCGLYKQINSSATSHFWQICFPSLVIGQRTKCATLLLIWCFICLDSPGSVKFSYKVGMLEIAGRLKLTSGHMGQIFARCCPNYYNNTLLIFHSILWEPSLSHWFNCMLNYPVSKKTVLTYVQWTTSVCDSIMEITSHSYTAFNTSVLFS